MNRFMMSAGAYGGIMKNYILREEAGEGTGGGGSASDPFDFADNDDEDPLPEKQDPPAGESSKAEEEKTEANPTEKKEEPSEKTEEKEKKEGDSTDDDQDDFFGLKEGSEKSEEVLLEEKHISKLAADLELTPGEGKELKTYEDFKEAYTAKLEQSRKEVNLDGYGPEAAIVIKALENGVTIDKIYTNERISQANLILEMDQNEKVLLSKEEALIEMGYSEEDAKAQAKTLVNNMKPEDIAREAGKIDALAVTARQAEITRMNNERQAAIDTLKAQEAKRHEADIKTVKQEIEKKTTFHGLPLTKEMKAAVLKDLESGELQKQLSINKADTLINAYLYKKFGAKILDMLEERVKEEKETTYLGAIKKVLKVLPQSESKKNVESNDVSGGANGKFSWSD